MPSKGPHTLDIFIVHTWMEWHLAKTVGHLLASQGYTVGASQPLAYPGCVDSGVDPEDARATIVIWPLNYDLCDRLEVEARSASRRGRLLQIYSSAVRPRDHYEGQQPVDFTGWDLTANSAKWDTLLEQLKPLCGPPPKSAINLKRAMPAVLGALTVVAGGGAAITFNLADRAPTSRMVTIDPHLEEPEAEPIRTVEEAHTVEPRVATGGALMIPEKDDQGVEVIVMTETEDKPPAPIKRAPQGPEP